MSDSLPDSGLGNYEDIILIHCCTILEVFLILFNESSLLFSDFISCAIVIADRA